MSARRACHARAQAGCGGGTARLGLGLRAAGQIHQHPQRFDDGALPYRAAADRAEAVLAVDDAAVARGDGEMHETDRLAGRGAAGTGNAGNGDGEINAGTLQRADRHGGGGVLADGAANVNGAGVAAEERDRARLTPSYRVRRKVVTTLEDSPAGRGTLDAYRRLRRRG